MQLVFVRHVDTRPFKDCQQRSFFTNLRRKRDLKCWSCELKDARDARVTNATPSWPDFSWEWEMRRRSLLFHDCVSKRLSSYLCLSSFCKQFLCWNHVSCIEALVVHNRKQQVKGKGLLPLYPWISFPCGLISIRFFAWSECHGRNLCIWYLHSLDGTMGVDTRRNVILIVHRVSCLFILHKLHCLWMHELLTHDSGHWQPSGSAQHVWCMALSSRMQSL